MSKGETQTQNTLDPRPQKCKQARKEADVEGGERRDVQTVVGFKGHVEINKIEVWYMYISEL